MKRYMESSVCLAVFALLCMGTVSCTKIQERTATNATLEGKVTYNGQPVPHALLIVAGTDSRTVNVGADGRYKIDQAPLGQVKIGVNTAAAKGRFMAEAAAKGQKGPGGAAAQGTGAMPQLVEVPEKFHSPGTSGIETTVKEGANTFNIELK